MVGGILRRNSMKYLEEYPVRTDFAWQIFQGSIECHRTQEINKKWGDDRYLLFDYTLEGDILELRNFHWLWEDDLIWANSELICLAFGGVLEKLPSELNYHGGRFNVTMRELEIVGINLESMKQSKETK